MRPRTLYLGGALVIAGLGVLGLWALFADEGARAPSLRGAPEHGGSTLERIAASRATAATAPPQHAAPPPASDDVGAELEADPTAPTDPAPDAAPPPTTRVSGTVVDPRGLPVADAAVRLVSASRRRRGRAVDTRSDGAGRFYAEVDGRQLWVQVSAEGYVREQRGVELPPGEEDLGEFQLARGARLSGRVTDPEGRPVADARVRVQGGRRGGRGPRETTDARGEFAFTLREGVYSLSAEAQGFVSTEVEDVPVTEELGGEASLVLQRGARLQGTVWGADGKPRPGAQVFAYRDGERLGAGSAGDDGRYAIDGIAPGPLELFARSDDRAFSCRVPIQVSAREQLQDVVLHESAKIVGQVRSPDGAPFPGLRVRAVEVRGDVRRRAETDAEGRFTIEHLYPGVYRLEVIREGSAPAGGEEVEVTRGTVERELILPRGARLSGTVRDDRGQPLEGAGVFAILDGDYLGSTRTDAEGRFEVESLPPGSYRLFVRGDGDRVVSLTPLEVAADAVLEGLSVVARPPARLRGKVVGPSGEGLAGIVVRLRGVDSPVERRARTNPDGSFELGPLYDGVYSGELSGDALTLLGAKLGREVQAPEVQLTIQNGRDAEQVWVVR
ncbi:MAG: carboxypeptidase regulatory-like domain-containing protein [Planctomycetes bacterium]|nr:carboxypeptidase regulatory-like domain-containing protein [Planctomycetota bacterium]